MKENEIWIHDETGDIVQIGADVGQGRIVVHKFKNNLYLGFLGIEFYSTYSYIGKI